MPFARARGARGRSRRPWPPGRRASRLRSQPQREGFRRELHVAAGVREARGELERAGCRVEKVRGLRRAEEREVLEALAEEDVAAGRVDGRRRGVAQQLREDLEAAHGFEGVVGPEERSEGERPRQGPREEDPGDGLEERVANGASFGEIQLGGLVRVVRREGGTSLGFLLAHPAAPQNGGGLLARGARDRPERDARKDRGREEARARGSEDEARLRRRLL